MTNQNSLKDGNLTQRLGNWLKETRQFATQTGCLEAIEPVLKILNKTGRDSINITFIGSPNSGKSSLINQLLDQKILPVTALSSNRQFLIQGNPENDKEGFILADDKVWHPLDNLHKNDFSPELSEALVTIYLCNQWLIKNNFYLIEKLALNASEEEFQNITNSLLEETDCVVLVIDALMPLNKGEGQFLSECSQRGIPIIIALSKINKLLEDEREDVIAYVSKYAESCSGSIKIIPTTDGISNLKTAIQETIDQTDIAFVRVQQVAYTLFSVLSVIHSAAQTALEVQKKNQQDKNLEIKKFQQQIDSYNLTWQQIEQQLNLKRHKLDDMLRKHLQNHQTNILEVLLYELERSNNVKIWWERDLPYRLQNELKSLANQLSGAINKQINLDLQWLEKEISQQFKYSFGALTKPGISVDQTPVEQKEMQLSDNNTLKILSRLGTAASFLILGTVLAGTGLAVSVIGGLAAEQIIELNTKKDRQKIRAELSKVIEQAKDEYAQEVSAKLKEAYQQIISNLKQHQLRWQQAQLQTLRAINSNSDSNSKINWELLLKQINQLMVEIKTEVKL